MKTYSIFKADLVNHEKDIIKIMNNNMREQLYNIDFSHETYKQRYLNNPFGSAHIWLAKHKESGDIIGMASLFPRILSKNRRSMYCGIASDFAVDKIHRSYGPALKLQKDILSNLENIKVELIYGLPIKTSYGIFLKIGYKKVGEFKNYIKLLKINKLLKNYLNSSVLANIISIIPNLIIKIISKDSWYKKRHNYKIITLDFFDDRFDIFWNKISDQYNIIGERSSIFLNWRYTLAPLEYKIFCILDEGKHISGYIIYFINNKECKIVDMIFDKSDDNILVNLISEFILFMRKDEVEIIAINCLENEMFEKLFKKFNFISLEKNTKNLMIYNTKHSIESDLLNKENWHFFWGDDIF